MKLLIEVVGGNIDSSLSNEYSYAQDCPIRNKPSEYLLAQIIILRVVARESGRSAWKFGVLPLMLFEVTLREAKSLIREAKRANFQFSM